jgi:hypothetical protein
MERRHVDEKTNPRSSRLSYRATAVYYIFIPRVLMTNRSLQLKRSVVSLANDEEQFQCALAALY